MGAFTLYIVATVTFMLMHSVPGDPLRQEKAVSDVVRNNLQVRYGLDKPIFEQYTMYMKNMFILVILESPLSNKTVL